MAVVGAAYANKRGPGRLFEIRMCSPGEPVTLRKEPKNPADSRAIGVYSARDIQIGYVRAEEAQLMGQYLDRHLVTAAFEIGADWGCLIRVTFDGSAPTIRKRDPAKMRHDSPDWPPKMEGDWGA